METLYIGCTCHCGDSVVVSAPDHGNVYLSFLSSLHKTAQHRFFKGLIEDLRAISSHGCLMEILVRREDLEAMRSMLQSAEYDEDEFQNEGHVTFSYYPDSFGYVIYLYSWQHPLRILAGKRFRCYEYCIGKRERDRMIKQIDRILKIGKGKAEDRKAY